jgi:tetratricopeptide (TPR) repeat protein
MFFIRLRRHAKWIFVVLALSFAFTFLFAGVGSGGSGGDVIGFLLGNRSTDPLKKAQKDVEKNPKNAKALLVLAQAYQGKDQAEQAAAAFERYLTLRPRDTTALLQLGVLSGNQAVKNCGDYQVAQQQLQDIAASTGLALGALGGKLGEDALSKPVIASANQRATDAYIACANSIDTWVKTYQRYASAVPVKETIEKARAEYQLGRVAGTAGQYAIAIAAYERFLKLAPDDPLAKEARSQLATLRKEQRNAQKPKAAS